VRQFYNAAAMDETLTTIPAYFDGEKIQLRVPYTLQPNAALLVTVLETPAPEPPAVNSAENERIKRFLSLKGIFKDDPEFDAAMEYLDQAWKQWTPPDFA